MNAEPTPVADPVPSVAESPFFPRGPPTDASPMSVGRGTVPSHRATTVNVTERGIHF